MSKKKLSSATNTQKAELLTSAKGKPIPSFPRKKQKSNFDDIFKTIIQKHVGLARLKDGNRRCRLSLFVGRDGKDGRVFHPVAQWCCFPKDKHPKGWKGYYDKGFWGLTWEFQQYRVNNLKCHEHTTCAGCGSYPCLTPEKPPCTLSPEQEKEWKKDDRPAASNWARSVYGEALELGEHFGVYILESNEENKFSDDLKSHTNFPQAKKEIEAEVTRSIDVENKLKTLGLSVNSWKQST